MVNGKRYANDIMIFPDEVVDEWWRKQGHWLQVDDLEHVLRREPKPEILVIGTGYFGLMRVSKEVQDALKPSHIRFIVQPTKQACRTFNGTLKSERRLAGAFHLTC